MNGPRTADDESRGRSMVETQLADDASVSGESSPRGQRAGGPHAPEGVTTIGKGVVIEGEVKGGEDLVIDGDSRRDDRVAATCPDRRSDGQGQGAVVGQVGRGSRQGEREHPGRASWCVSATPARSKVLSRLRGWPWPTGHTCRVGWTCRPRDSGLGPTGAYARSARFPSTFGPDPLAKTPAAQGAFG